MHKNTQMCTEKANDVWPVQNLHGRDRAVFIVGYKQRPGFLIARRDVAEETRMGALKMSVTLSKTSLLFAAFSLLLAGGQVWAQGEPLEPDGSAKASADKADKAEEAAPEASKKKPTVLLIPYCLKNIRKT